jgi:hypothetical protein
MTWLCKFVDWLYSIQCWRKGHEWHKLKGGHNFCLRCRKIRSFLIE